MDPNEQALLEELRALGLDSTSYRAVALLPLVEVAWADATIQDEERRMIMDVARGHELLAGNGAQVVEGWLAQRPEPAFFERGRRVFVELAHRGQGLGADMPRNSLEFVVDLCSVVAESAGGLFGMFFQVSPAEQEAIRRVANAIDAEAARIAGPMRGVVGHDPGNAWQDMLEELTEEVAPAAAPAPRRKKTDEERAATARFTAIKD